MNESEKAGGRAGGRRAGGRRSAPGGTKTVGGSPLGPETESDPAGEASPRREPGAAVPPVLALREGKGGILRADDASLSPESLPVLNAFRQFLETERRRTRRQIAGLSVLFGLLLAAAMVGGFLVARMYWQEVQTDLAAEQRKSEVSRRSMASAVQNIAATTGQFGEDLQAQRMAIEQVQSNIESRVKQESRELEQFRDLIDTLEIRNAGLAYAVQDMLSSRPAAPASFVQPGPPGGRPEMSGPAPSPPAVAAPGPSPAPGSASFGGSRTAAPAASWPSNTWPAVRFRLPLP